ncbi:hypothetical protein C5Y96_20945 [Blastopirellula marina]|uniref:Uncharacterized protein n=1 Tax=Blastopirellula marina TaxID=124 RepID=A0A2S8F177_9BACT|nr:MULTISPECIES: hypothetical protein [Pirellulaceae]PQO25925.1 hypothetical protein C5Y96_20945 [Blastopirellula marina]RCS44283.1 hypothetical protein DTL36_20990 [Bremerella cremea]
MTLNQSQQSKSRVCLPRLSAHLAAATLLFGGVQATWGQDAAESRWSTNNPPTPAMVQASQKPQDQDLRRLPPIDQEVTSPAKPSSFTAIEQPAEKPQIAAQPQSAPLTAQNAEPVNWSSPKIVIGPEATTRTVSHEEVVTAPKQQMTPSRYSSAPETAQAAATNQGPSRFSQTAPESPKQEVAPEAEKPAAPVFARVFDEQVESSGITQPEVATEDTGLSPIFACRLLGLRATKSESNSVR